MSLYLVFDYLGFIAAGGAPAIADTALRLARYFGTSAEMWAGLQADYDLRLARCPADRFEILAVAADWRREEDYRNRVKPLLLLRHVPGEPGQIDLARRDNPRTFHLAKTVENFNPLPRSP